MSSEDLGAGPYVDLLSRGQHSKLGGEATSGSPFWEDNPDAWDAVYLGGMRIPGLCAVSGKGFEQRIDKKKTAGKHGAKLTHTGNDCADFEIAVRMWTPEHLRDFERLMRELKREDLELLLS